MSDTPGPSFEAAPPPPPPRLGSGLDLQRRILAGVYLAAVPLGVVGAVLDVLEFLNGGSLNIGLSLGAGVSGWALGVGLWKGTPRMLRWGRRIATAALLFAAAGFVLVTFVFERLRATGPFGEMEITTLQAVGGLMVVVAFFGWQRRVMVQSLSRIAADDPPSSLPRPSP